MKCKYARLSHSKCNLVQFLIVKKLQCAIVVILIDLIQLYYEKVASLKDAIFGILKL